MSLIEKAYASAPEGPPPVPLYTGHPFTIRIEELALRERDAVRRNDWHAARGAVEERVALQEARGRASATRWT